MDAWVAFTFWLLRIVAPWTWVCKYLFESLLSLLLGIYPEVGLLEHMVILCLIFWGITTLFSTAWLQHFTFTPAMHRFPISPHPCQHLLLSYFLSLIVAILMSRHVICLVSQTIPMGSSTFGNDPSTCFPRTQQPIETSPLPGWCGWTLAGGRASGLEALAGRGGAPLAGVGGRWGHRWEPAVQGFFSCVAQGGGSTEGTLGS